MKIPIQYILLMFIEAFPLIKGEKCWMPMVCDGKPTWKNVTEGPCTKEEEKALEDLTEKLDEMESKLFKMKKTMEKSETNSVPPSVVNVKETTTPSAVGVKGTTTPQVDLTCDFESSTNPTCGYTRVNGTFQREYRDDEVTGYVLAGNGTIRSLPKTLAGNEELCMSVDIKGTSDGELVAKAYNGTVTKAIWPFSASTSWKTEKFILKKVNSTDTKVQLELEASGNVELDNITTLNSAECYSLATPCAKKNLKNGTISPEQDLYTEDQEVSYFCSNDSILEGGLTGTCKSDGSWSTTPVCTKCGVVYDAKCFRAIFYKTRNVTSSVAETLCRNKLANIYDVTHYNMLRDYLRSLILDGKSWITVRTGMTYKNGQLYTTTGQAMTLPTAVWSPDTTDSGVLHTTVVFEVDRNPKYQWIYNDSPSTKFHGAICENEL
uniref:uncharacterized protein LOC120346973 n=1 Tax=Styela clava TaxID=7725 RepID=UPI00193ACEDB|nr:uncharacterized protein LOC120346973 [Styela clava]